MTNDQLIALLQQDLKNERKHLAAYTQFGVQLRGLHREELREFCQTQAADELLHVTQFSELIVHLGGVPGTEVNDYPSDLTCPVAIVKAIVEMEDEVADAYAERLRQTHEMENSATAYCHVFYEEQIADSWKTAREVEQMIPRHTHDNKL
jgi:bacterioferritin (cytochrome b1)